MELEFSLSHQGVVLIIFGELAFPGLQEIPGRSLIRELLDKVSSKLLSLRYKVPRSLTVAPLITQTHCPLTLYEAVHRPSFFCVLGTLCFSPCFSLLILLCLSVFSTPILGTSLQWSLISPLSQDWCAL